MHSRTFAVIALLSVAACDDSASEPTGDAARLPTLDAAVGRVDAGIDADLDARRPLDATLDVQRDAQASACELPADCAGVHTFALDLVPCCGASFRCGLDFVTSSILQRDTFYTALGVDPAASCVPDSKLFFTGPTIESQRVPIPDGGQVLISTSCTAAYATSLAFRGCCLPNDECGISSFPSFEELQGLVGGAEFPFTKIECVKSEQLNAQLRASPLAGFARLPSTSGRCDYAALDGTLAHPTP